MLKGRLGLEKSRIAYADRHALLWLDYGRLETENGCGLAVQWQAGRNKHRNAGATH